MADVTFALANYDGGLKELPRSRASGTFTISASHHWLLNVGNRWSKGAVNGVLDRWEIDVASTGAQSCRVNFTSRSDSSVHFAFDLPGTSAEALLSELETHAQFVRLAEQREVEVQQLSDEEIVAALGEVNRTIESNYKDKEARLTAWQEEITLRRELELRHRVVIPSDILQGTLSPHHVFIATGGSESLVAELRSRQYQAAVASSVLALQRATTPEGRDAANRRLVGGAGRIWLSMQPEYDGRFDPDHGLMARGWVERSDGSVVEGMFNANQAQQGLTFLEVGGKPPISVIPWSEVNWVQRVPRSDLSAAAIRSHAEILANKACTDPYALMGFMSGPLGRPESDAFVLVPMLLPPRPHSAQEWIDVFQRARVEIRPPSPLS